jgi:hypothetical protein
MTKVGKVLHGKAAIVGFFPPGLGDSNVDGDLKVIDFKFEILG